MEGRGLRFERYEIEKELGEGGSGSVFLAKDIRLGRRVAVKVIKEAGAQFTEEIKILQRQGLFMLPVIYDAWREEDGRGIIIMEYVEGKSLKEYLSIEKHLSERRIYLWGIQLGEFLRTLHSLNPKVLYRDIKPENIIVTPDGKLRLVDVGAAVCTSDAQIKERKRIGTWGYASPEQWEGKEVDERTDIYGMGAVLRDMALGSCKGGKTVNCGNLLWETGIPERMEEIIRKCLEKEAGKRYATAEAFLEDWKEYRKAGGKKLWRLFLANLWKHAFLLAAALFLWQGIGEGAAKYGGNGAAGKWIVMMLLAAYGGMKLWEYGKRRRKEKWVQKKSVWLRGWEELFG